MAWKWLGSGEQPGAEDWIGFLATGVRLEGTLELAGTFRVDAQVKGSIVSNTRLLLGESARVEGQIEGNQVVVGGRFDGVIFARGRVEIQAKGVVTGEVHTPCLVIEPGGIFDGRCHMLGSAEATKPLTIPFRVANQG